MSDWELLEDYVKRRSEAAFAELVRRHINWVHSVALRRVGDPGLAEDIVQAAFVSKRFVADPGPPGSEDPRWLRREDLRASKARMVLEPGYELKGFVLDDTGAPLAAAKVSQIGGSNYEPGSVKTGADGSFRMTSLPQGAAQVSAWAKGFAPCLLGIQVGSNSPAAVFRLNHGAKFSFRIVDDQEGAGIPDAWATINLSIPHNAEFRAITDAAGRATLEGIPTNVLGGLVFHAGAQGYFIAHHIALRHDNPDPVIRLTKSLRVSGTVREDFPTKPGQAVLWLGQTANSIVAGGLYGATNPATDF